MRFLSVWRLDGRPLDGGRRGADPGVQKGDAVPMEASGRIDVVREPPKPPSVDPGSRWHRGRSGENLGPRMQRCGHERVECSGVGVGPVAFGHRTPFPIGCDVCSTACATYFLAPTVYPGDAASVDDVKPPEPRLSGIQIALRPFETRDAEAVAAACADPDILRFTMMPDGLTETSAAEWIEHGLEWWERGIARFAIVEPSADRCVGQIGIQLDQRARRAEAFYWVDRSVRGRGVATEALDLVTRWAFREFRIVRVQLLTHPDNEASQRVAERCGFTREGVVRAWGLIKGEQPDLVMFSRLASDPFDPAVPSASDHHN